MIDPGITIATDYARLMYESFIHKYYGSYILQAELRQAQSQIQQLLSDVGESSPEVICYAI